MDHLHREIAKLRLELDVARRELSDIRRSLDDKGVRFHGIAGLTPAEAKIVGLLVERGRVAHEVVFNTVGNRESHTVTSAFVVRARQKLKPYGIGFKTLRGYGFEMSLRDRAKARELANIPTVESPSLMPEAA